ncbi:MAG TPA: hypothetical protein VFO95_14615, partial [Gemmatimonadales bacterium]|nr:hypothetical protein [Gemmatimonadales bacterium]
AGDFGNLEGIRSHHDPIHQFQVLDPPGNPDDERLAGEKLKRLMWESSRAETRRNDGENRHQPK